MWCGVCVEWCGCVCVCGVCVWSGVCVVWCEGCVGVGLRDFLLEESLSITKQIGISIEQMHMYMHACTR